jgi:tetratricopeptide (TPR) repeat protein
MPGNRQVYEQAMNAGHSAAWDQDWVVAVEAYGRAIREFPNDPDAHIHLGLGLLELGRLDDAYKVYARAHQLAPDDPIPLEKSADVLERLGRLREAAQQYVNVSEIYLSQRDLDKAIMNWERATRLTPGLIQVHAKLAQAYERIGDKKKAIREYLLLAYNFQRTNDSDKALKAAQRALRIDPGSAVILNTIRALEAGRPIQPPPPDDTPAQVRPGAFDKEARGLAGKRPGSAEAEADPLGPLGEAMTDALGMLALNVMESGQLEAATEALQAMELQRQGVRKEAIEAYRRAETKLRMPALKLNLGALLLLDDRPAEALKPLTEAGHDSQLAPGAEHGLALAYLRQGKHREAIRHFLNSLELVESQLSMVSEFSLDAIDAPSIYQTISAQIPTLTDEASERTAKRLKEMLEGKEWKARLPDTRRQWEETLREQGIKGLLDILQTEGGDRLTRSIALIDRYMRQGLLTLAMDEAHYAVEFAPNYLPLHIRMAEIMMREQRVRSAIAKYNVIARTFMARGESDRAAQILMNVLELAPLDISVRESLIELLESQERWDEALDQYIDLADTYHQLGNFDQSRDTYVLAERIANRQNAPTEKIIRIKHRIADIDQMRLDIRRAQKTYEEIIALNPEDERAHRMLLDLNYRQGNTVEAIRRLDKLLSVYARQKQVNRIVQTLEELVTLYPNDTGLRSRLASIYKQLGRVNDAIVQLDALGELQLEAGLNKDAANTIRQIIALNPTHADEYRKLLAQLGG